MITMDDIIREGHPTLREVAKEVIMPPSEEEKRTLKDMRGFLINSQDPEIAEQYNLRAGVGLAAPQINVPKRMIAVKLEDDKGVSYEYALFNPKIVSHSLEKSFLTTGEGCLSVDRNVEGLVVRYARITVTGTDLDGMNLKMRLRGLPAIVFQHEIDHLNGVMFYDHIDPSNPDTIPEGAIAIER
jgi:peptide deformylase